MKPMRPGGPTSLPHQDITDGIIGAFYRVYNGLG
jgi:hypothetical protein